MYQTTELSKNCNEWAQYEPPGTSETANICNGGRYGTRVMDVCESRQTCRVATAQAEGGHRRHLPVMGQQFGSRVIGSTPAAQQAFGSRPPRDYTWQPSVAPTSIPQRQQQVTPQVVVPPQTAHPHMQTPYVQPQIIAAGGMQSPTFLPAAEESPFARIAKNILQGWFTATGWQIFEAGRSTDLFRK